MGTLDGVGEGRRLVLSTDTNCDNVPTRPSADTQTVRDGLTDPETGRSLRQLDATHKVAAAKERPSAVLGVTFAVDLVVANPKRVMLVAPVPGATLALVTALTNTPSELRRAFAEPTKMPAVMPKESDTGLRAAAFTDTDVSERHREKDSPPEPPILRDSVESEFAPNSLPSRVKLVAAVVGEFVFWRFSKEGASQEKDRDAEPIACRAEVVTATVLPPPRPTPTDLARSEESESQGAVFATEGPNLVAGEPRVIPKEVANKVTVRLPEVAMFARTGEEGEG